MSQLKETALDVMEAFVICHVDDNDVHTAAYKDRWLLWTFLKADGHLTGLLELLCDNFCRLLGELTKGSEKVARLLVAWYRLSNSTVTDKWKQTLSTEYPDPVCVKDVDAHAIMLSLGSAVYTCLQKQVGVLYTEYLVGVLSMSCHCMTHGVLSNSMLYLQKLKLMMMLRFTAYLDSHSLPVFVTENVQYLVALRKDVSFHKGTGEYARNRQVCATCCCCLPRPRKNEISTSKVYAVL